MTPMLLFVVQTHRISHKTWLLLELWWYTPIQGCDILSHLNLVMSP